MTDRAGLAPLEAGRWVLSPRLSRWLDPALGLVAAILASVSVLGTDLATIDPRLVPAGPVSVTATAIAGLSLAWRRTRPATSFVVFMAACLVITLTDHYVGLLSVLLLVSLYSLTVHGSRRHGVWGLLAGILVFNALSLLDIPDLRTSDLLQACALLVVTWAVGDAVRARRAHQAQRIRRAEEETAAARDAAARAVTDERLRIARELHDLVAHSMSLIAVQSGVGAHVIRTDVGAAEHALEVIAETSRDALTQTRAMLGLLRDEGSSAATAPVQSLGDLDRLLSDVRRAGVEVELVVEGDRRPLGAGVELAAYRVVQESLTNVLRHSSVPRATVRLRYDDDSLDIEVRDPGANDVRAVRVTGDPGGGGHGLLGLRERARLLGGSLEYAAHVDGFRVSAHLPAPVAAS